MRHNDYYTGAPTTERSYIHYIPNYIYLRGERHDLIHAPALALLTFGTLHTKIKSGYRLLPCARSSHARAPTPKPLFLLNHPTRDAVTALAAGVGHVVVGLGVQNNRAAVGVKDSPLTFG